MFVGERSPLAADITVVATVQPAVVSVGAEATLVVTVKGKFRKSSQPRLPSIDEITFYQAGSSQSFSIVNGQATSSLQFSYVIIPHKEGRYTIQPIEFETGGNTYIANAVVIDVVKSPAQIPPPIVDAEPGEGESDSPIFIRASVDRDTVYVNEQITWMLGFYTDGRVELLRSPEYSPPNAEGFWVEDLPPQQNRYKMINGTKYLVNEIKRGFFPTAPGVYRIGSARVEIVLDDFGDRTMDDFFSRRLRTFGFGKPKTLTTNELPIVVLPLPRSGRPKNFSGLVGRDLTVSLKTDKQVVRVGDPINVTLEIAGKGNFKTMAAPEIPDMNGFKLYESGSTSELFKQDYVVSGRKRIEFVLIPQVEGATEIPSVEVSYFDPVARSYNSIRSASVQLSVQPGEKETGRQVVFTGTGEDIEVLGRDIHFIHPVPAEITLGHTTLYGGVYAALHALPLLAVITSLVVARRRKQWMQDAPSYRARRAAREAEKQLKTARDRLSGETVAEVFSDISLALRQYAGAKMRRSASGLTNEEVERFLEERGVPQSDIDALGSVLKICDGARYSSASSSRDQAEETLTEAGRVIERLESRGLEP